MAGFARIGSSGGSPAGQSISAARRSMRQSSSTPSLGGSLGGNTFGRPSGSPAGSRGQQRYDDVGVRPDSGLSRSELNSSYGKPTPPSSNASKRGAVPRSPASSTTSQTPKG